MFDNVRFDLLQDALIDTIYMTFVTLIFVLVFGFLIGYVLYLTESKKGILKVVHQLLVFLTNIARSIPFLILMILIMPLTKQIIGTILGSSAAIPALVISATPFYARLVYQSLREIPKSIIEMLESLGKTTTQMTPILLKESLPGLISGLVITSVTLIGFTSISGVIGAGGLGHLAYQSGFVKNDQTMILLSTLTVLALVFLIQGIGDFIVKKIDKRL